MMCNRSSLFAALQMFLALLAVFFENFIPEFTENKAKFIFQNYDKYLSSIGVTPLMAQMVLRSDFMITIYEDIDKCWKMLTETR